MKFYEYISDAKVDMLLPQVPLAIKQRISSELGIDFKIFNAKIKSEVNTLENRIAKLRSVVQYVNENENIGTLENPEKWIYGETEASCGYIGDTTDIIAYTGGMVGGCYILAGSSGHAIGADPNDEAVGFGFSFLPRLMRSLKRTSEFLEESISDVGEENESPIQGLIGKGDVLEDSWNKFIQNVWKKFDGPTVKIEFLARRLLVTGQEGRISLLITPLYVARLD